VYMQIPSQLLVWDSLPRNAMGKVGPLIHCVPLLFDVGFVNSLTIVGGLVLFSPSPSCELLYFE
jgi:hypothetical protein